jgi:lysophospholipase L1-like esterase
MPRLLCLCLLLTASTMTLAQSKAKDKSPSRWEKAITAIEKRDKAKPPPPGAIFFCGSSSIVKWDLAKYFPMENVFNRGFGGSVIADSTHFAPRIILPYKPAAIVFYAGDNDIGAGKSAETVLADFSAFVKVVHDKLPKTKILFLAVKPSIARWKRIDTIRKANSLIEALCKKEDALAYVDVATPMLGADGRPRKELFVKDGLHMSPEGYALWTKIVKEHLKGSAK